MVPYGLGVQAINSKSQFMNLTDFRIPVIVTEAYVVLLFELIANHLPIVTGLGWGGKEMNITILKK